MASRVLLLPACALALAAAAPAVAAQSPGPPAQLEAQASFQATPVRRWEYVVLVRTSDEAPGAIGRVEAAAFRAGGAVLEQVRSEWDGQSEDWRLLVRTRHSEGIHPVLREIRGQRGVIGATAMPLPETPTWAGSPGFMSSYMSPDDRPTSNAGRVVMRHDMPPVVDQRELLESAEVLAGPHLQAPNGMLDVPVGGFTLNVSELFARLKQAAWRKREDRMRDAPLAILPTEPASSVGAEEIR